MDGNQFNKRESTFCLAELFRSAAEAGPLDIVKLRKGDKLLNISTHLPANTPDTPYVLQVLYLNFYFYVINHIFEEIVSDKFFFVKVGLQKKGKEFLVTYSKKFEENCGNSFR